MLLTIQNECSQFLTESRGYPLLKNLPTNQDGFRKVKVRKKKNLKNEIIEAFNDTFKSHTDLMQRSIFAHSVEAFQPSKTADFEPFFIFPINGYKYLYAQNVANTTETYKTTLSTLIENYGENGIKTFQEVLKHQYSFSDLENGLSSKTEVIVYDIPYYYAIRYSLIEEYEEFLNLI
jgi:hypothetical protein